MSISRVNTLKMTGMNSGLDTEAIVEAMTLTTKNKIDNNNKKITKLSWKQDAYRDVISKITNFQNSYFDSLKSSSYLLSKNMFSEYKKSITANGAEVTSGLSVTTSVNSTEGTHKLELTQLAQNSKIEGSAMATPSFKLDIDAAMAIEDANRAESDTSGNYAFTLDVTVGATNDSVTFFGTTKEELINDLNTKLADKFGESTFGNKYIQASEDANGDLQFDVTGNINVSIKESDGYFGLNGNAYTVTLNPSTAITGKNSVIMEIDGEAKQIDLDLVNASYFDNKDKEGYQDVLAEYNKLKEAAYRKEYEVSDDDSVTESALGRFSFSTTKAAAQHNAKIIDEKLNAAYESEGITFKLDDSYNLTAEKTTEIDNGDGTTSTKTSPVAFKLTSYSGGTLGISAKSAANTNSVNSTLASLGVNGIDENGKYNIQINGKDIAIANTSTIKDFVSTVNASKAGVTMSYSAMTGQFTVESTDYGTASKVEIKASEFTKSLGLTANDDGTVTTVQNGSNAIVTVDGREIINNSNSVVLDGSTYTFDENAAVGTEYTVGLTKSYDSAKEVIKKFAEDYNKMIEDVYGYIGTKVAKDSSNNTYEPLTDEEKEEMSETEIEKWEEKAKQGILYGDSDITSVMSKMRSSLYESITLSDGSKFSLYDMGITTSTDYAEHGKLEIDETQLDKAFSEHGEDIMELFTNKTDGVMAKFNNIMTSAVKSTGARQDKGSLVQIAGLASGTSATDNRIYDEMERLGDTVDKLINYYESRQDYYWSIYSSLESRMSDLNSQTSYITQMMNM